MTRVLRAARAPFDRRHWWRASIGAAILLATVLVPASPAAATGTGDYNSSGVRIRSCPFTTSGCTIRGLGYPGQGVTVYCYKTGTVVNGDPYWLYHRNRTTGVTGYSSDLYINFTGTVPHC